MLLALIDEKQAYKYSIDSSSSLFRFFVIDFSIYSFFVICNICVIAAYIVLITNETKQKIVCVHSICTNGTQR
jgi:hypothetical protein